MKIILLIFISIALADATQHHAYVSRDTGINWQQAIAERYDTLNLIADVDGLVMPHRIGTVDVYLSVTNGQGHWEYDLSIYNRHFLARAGDTVTLVIESVINPTAADDVAVGVQWSTLGSLGVVSPSKRPGLVIGGRGYDVMGRTIIDRGGRHAR